MFIHSTPLIERFETLAAVVLMKDQYSSYGGNIAIIHDFFYYFVNLMNYLIDLCNDSVLLQIGKIFPELKWGDQERQIDFS